MSNSKQQLLDYMRARETTQDWGAISIFGRARLNRLLEQQFVAGFDEFSFLPPFNIERINLNDDTSHWMKLDSIILSKPLLSFESASLDNSEATLKLGIMAGTVTTYRKPGSAPKMLESSFHISEQQGYVLEMTINLHLVTGEVDDLGRVTLDLRNSLKFKSNLSDLAFPQLQIGEAFGAWLRQLPRHKRVFELGALKLRGYNPLTPTTFHIRTQAAPGAKHRASANYGEGAVLIFVALKGKPSPGYFPGEGSGFPYFIPDDQDSEGRDLYSAALVLSHDMTQYVEPDRLELINSLLFPGENVFVESSRHSPKDLIVFGNIDPTLTSITLEPLIKMMHVGSTQQFTVHQVSKSLDTASVQWSVRSINTHDSAGSISTTGLYQSPHTPSRQTVRNVVTARYTDPVTGDERRASALVGVSHEAVTVAPQISYSYLGIMAEPVKLFAVSLGGGLLKWTLLEPTRGSLTSNDNQAIYTPPENLEGTLGLAVERIQVQDSVTGFKAQATVLLLARDQTLTITPPYTSSVQSTGQVQLAVAEDYPPEFLQWSLSSGEGTVSAGGLFTAPEQWEESTSVVRCQLVRNESVFAAGYSVISLNNLSNAPSWNKLQNFELTAAANQVRAYANGYQQMVVDVLIETEQVNGVDIPISLDELSSLTLVSRGGQELDYLPTNELGIAEGAHYSWAVRTEPNKFNAYGNALLAGSAPTFEVLGAQTRMRLYVHTRGGEPQTLHARFISDFNDEHNSTDKSQEPPHVLELVPVTVPQFRQEDYTLEIRRVAGGGNTPPQQEDYDYKLNTTDYWYLEFTGRTGESVRFMRCEFEDNQSTLQWESRRQWETMFSYTGYIFNVPPEITDPAVTEDDDPTIMHYDTRLKGIMPNHTLKADIENGQVVGEGQLMISLFRVDNLQYTSNNTTLELEKPLKLYLLDKNGNRHRLNLAFAPMEVADSRNKLLLNVI